MTSFSQRGVSLITAIFLLVVIAALGVFAVTLSTTQNQSQTMDVMGARAYQAALAGVEWAAFNATSQTGAAWLGAGCPASSTLALAGNLAPFIVTVNCSMSIASEAASAVAVFNVSAVAKTTGAPGDVNYVEQIAEAKLVR